MYGTYHICAPTYGIHGFDAPPRKVPQARFQASPTIDTPVTRALRFGVRFREAYTRITKTCRTTILVTVW